MREGLPPCKNFDDPDVPTLGAGGCRNQSDPSYTMDFTDVEPGAYIYWCKDCGPEAMAMDEALKEAFDTRGPEFAKELNEAIDRVRQGDA